MGTTTLPQQVRKILPTSIGVSTNTAEPETNSSSKNVIPNSSSEIQVNIPTNTSSCVTTVQTGQTNSIDSSTSLSSAIAIRHHYSLTVFETSLIACIVVFINVFFYMKRGQRDWMESHIESIFELDFVSF
jgi:hypothetical protein